MKLSVSSYILLHSLVSIAPIPMAKSTYSYTVGMSPRIQDFRCELRAVIDANRFWQLSIARPPLQDGDDIAITHPLAGSCLREKH